jgi:hypothetical protein
VTRRLRHSQEARTRRLRWCRRVWVAAAGAVSVALSGCSLALKVPTQPGSSAASGTAGRTTSRTASVTVGASSVPAAPHQEVPTPPGPDERTPASAHSAPAALASFARRYINWTAMDVKAQLEQLAADSVGQARSAMALDARQTGADPELAQAGVANHGVVEAVAALGGGHGRWVVVTRESTTATNSAAYQGLAPAWHLAVATVVRRGDGWVVSSWQPED